MRWFSRLSGIVALGLVTLSLAGNEPGPAATDHRYLPDVQRLMQTRYFGMGGFGLPTPRAPDEPPELLEGAVLLRRLLRREDAIHCLFPVFDEGTLEARCYALVGFRELAPEYFEICARRLDPWSQQEVRVAAGCIIQRRTLGDLIPEIRRGTFSTRSRRP